MKKFILLLYNYLPKTFIKKIGSSSALKGLRNFFLRKDSIAKNIIVKVKREYPPFSVSFKYCAPIRDAAKAKKRGVENTLLRNTIKLLNDKGIAEKATVMDIGANYGYLSMVWSQTLAKNGGTVHSFEPGKNIYRTFKETLRQNGQLVDNIIPVNKAVGRESGDIELIDFGTTSNINQNIDFNIQSRYIVPLLSIDDYVNENSLSKIDLIKIDVDGIEYDILQGAKSTLLMYKPVLAIETNNDSRIISFCLELGYAIYNMSLSRYEEPAEVPLNIFCV